MAFPLYTISAKLYREALAVAAAAAAPAQEKKGLASGFLKPKGGKKGPRPKAKARAPAPRPKKEEPSLEAWRRRSGCAIVELDFAVLHL